MNELIYKKIDYDNFKIVLNNYLNQKNLFNNFFDLNNYSSDLEVYLGDNSLLIRKPDNDFYRCFIISANFQEAVKLLQNQGFENVLNIPTKKAIDDWDELFFESGYSCIGVYERMYYKEVKKRTNRIPIFAQDSSFEQIHEILCSHFDNRIDHIPNRETLRQMILNKQVIVSHNNSHNYGVIIYTLEGKKCYLNAWIDSTGDGLLLLFDVFNIMHKTGVVYSYFWVNSKNENVIKIHKILGAKPDGLKDYTFIKAI